MLVVATSGLIGEWMYGGVQASLPSASGFRWHFSVPEPRVRPSTLMAGLPALFLVKRLGRAVYNGLPETLLLRGLHEVERGLQWNMQKRRRCPPVERC